MPRSPTLRRWRPPWRDERSSIKAPRSLNDPTGVRVWVPIVEGSDRTGVLAVTVPEATDDVVTACEELGLFAGYLIATHARSTDLYNLHRRRRALSLPASMQWDLLPPLVLKTDRMVVAGLLEPAYDVGGDCFDYALNRHRVRSCPVRPRRPRSHLGAHRRALCRVLPPRPPREQRSRADARPLDLTTADAFPHLAFATGQLARVDLDTGAMTWTNAGHPLPMLIRGGQVVKQLDCPPTLPWGLGELANPTRSTTVATEALEPGDSVLFYTDGVVEAHLPGHDQFGVERLADLVGQHASDQLEPEAVISRLVRAVLEHQDDQLADDATLVLFQWNGPMSG